MVALEVANDARRRAVNRAGGQLPPVLDHRRLEGAQDSRPLVQRVEVVLEVEERLHVQLELGHHPALLAGELEPHVEQHVAVAARRLGVKVG